MKEIQFVNPLHVKSRRDYLDRVNNFNKGDCAVVAKKFGKEYWDGGRQYGYGGYSYDGRWHNVATAMADYYQIKAGDRILDVGCGKGFLLYEFTQAVPGVEVFGLDISEYAVENSKPEVKKQIAVGNAKKLPYESQYFDLVLSNMTLHNLKIFDLFDSVREISRVMKDKAWIGLESYRNEHEKANLLYWQLTCEAFYSPEEWLWVYQQCEYGGDYEFLCFE